MVKCDRIDGEKAVRVEFEGHGVQVAAGGYAENAVAARYETVFADENAVYARCVVGFVKRKGVVMAVFFRVQGDIQRFRIDIFDFQAALAAHGYGAVAVYRNGTGGGRVCHVGSHGVGAAESDGNALTVRKGKLCDA